MKGVELAQEAQESTVESYLRLASSVKSLLESERQGKRVINVEGGLITLSSGKHLIIVGDIHGDLDTLSWILDDCGFFKKYKDNYLIFMGDYGDRGVKSPEVYYVIYKLKLMYPDNVILLRGNHEGPDDLLAYPHDLPFYMKLKYGYDWKRAYRATREIFNKMHHAVVVPGKYLIVHGGVPTMMSKKEEIAMAHELHPQHPFLEELLWNDPIEELGSHPSYRGAGMLFGPDITKKVLKIMNAKILIRGHQACDYGVCSSQGGLTLTIFSRRGPPYYNEYAAYLKVDLSMDIKNSYELARLARRLS